MKIPKYSTALLVIIALISFVGKNAVENHKKHKALLPSLKTTEASYQAHSLKLYNLGFSNLIADLLWVELLQQADHRPVPEGQVSWEFAQLDGITTLDPNFDRAFSFGSIFLSVLRQDKLGAKTILEKWVSRRPIYWKSNYMLGYQLAFELNEREKGAKYLLKAASLEGAPYYLSSLGVRLLEETEGLRQALRISCELFPGLNSSNSKERMVIRIRSIVFALQKSFWEKALTEFKKKNGRPPQNNSELSNSVIRQEREIASDAIENDQTPELTELLAETYGFHYSPTKKVIEPDKTLKQLGLEIIGIHR